MKTISELQGILSGFLNWNKSRLDCLSHLLLALFAVKTVNLREIAVAFKSSCQLDSRYKRIKRFFRQVDIDVASVGKWIFSLFFTPEQTVYLTIDRTNWFWGKAKINILTVSAAYEGIAIPLYWTLLDKAGNALASEHIAILSRAVELFGSHVVAGILGDREFAHGSLFKWCNDNQLPFYIRIKDNAQIYIRKKKWITAKKVFEKLSPKEQKRFDMSVMVYGQRVFLAGARSERGELMVVATNKNPTNAISIYLRRWEIEMLFQSLKSRGFRFEETHLTHRERIEKLMAVLAIGFAFAHKVGEWVAEKRPIIFNQYRDSQRPQYSFFRYGLDKIREAVLGNFSGKNPLLEYFKVLKLNKINIIPNQRAGL
jgi:hypothetical protein